jgi:MFS family permease
MSSSSDRPAERGRFGRRDRDGDGVDDRREAATGPARRGAVAAGRPHVGINWGSAFFGWVAAMGLAVILTALAAAVGAAIGVTQTSGASQATNELSQNARSIGIGSGIVLAVIVFLAYFCGGYVAARMSRFEGVRQGLAVWLWAIIIAILVAIIAAVAGSRYDVLSALNSFPRLPVDQGALTTGGIIALLAFLLISLLGALLGGRAGMHYHRKLERAGPVVEA